MDAFEISGKLREPKLTRKDWSTYAMLGFATLLVPCCLLPRPPRPHTTHTVPSKNNACANSPFPHGEAAGGPAQRAAVPRGAGVLGAAADRGVPRVRGARLALLHAPLGRAVERPHRQGADHQDGRDHRAGPPCRACPGQRSLRRRGLCPLLPHLLWPLRHAHVCCQYTTPRAPGTRITHGFAETVRLRSRRVCRQSRWRLRAQRRSEESQQAGALNTFTSTTHATTRQAMCANLHGVAQWLCACACALFVAARRDETGREGRADSSFREGGARQARRRCCPAPRTFVCRGAQTRAPWRPAAGSARTQAAPAQARTGCAHRP